MGSTWNILKETSSMSNVIIVCSDGIIQTHKIVVASASGFIKHLLSEVPVGDEITLYLPDHQKTSVLGLLNGVFSQEKPEDSSQFISLLCEPVLLKVSCHEICETFSLTFDLNHMIAF